MLDICFGDFANRGEAKQVVIVCDSCDEEAFIFQEKETFALGVGRREQNHRSSLGSCISK